MYTFRWKKFINKLNLIMKRLNLKEVKANKLKKKHNDINNQPCMIMIDCI